MKNIKKICKFTILIIISNKSMGDPGIEPGTLRSSV